MDNSKTVDVLNKLVVINNDRIEGYVTAQGETEQADLRALFAQFEFTSLTCRNELVAEIRRLDGTPDEGTRVSGKFFRVWMEVKAALTGNDRKAILNSCEYGEEVAFDTYNDVLNDHAEDLAPAQRSMLLAQQASLHTDHQTIKNQISLLA